MSSARRTLTLLLNGVMMLDPERLGKILALLFKVEPEAQVE
jgi:hypothetical protein